MPEARIGVVAGDICPDFTPFGRRMDRGELRQSYWLGDEFIPWMAKQPIDEWVIIAGNHDFVFQRSFLLPKWPSNVHYLKDSEVSIGGCRFWGTPWVPLLSSWAFYASDTALQARAESIPTGIDVLVTHGPPYGLGDQVSPRGYMRAGESVGDPHLLNELARIGARFTFTGHIHEAFGEFKHGDKQIVSNVSLLNERYERVNQPMLYFLPDKD